MCVYLYSQWLFFQQQEKKKKNVCIGLHPTQNQQVKFHKFYRQKCRPFTIEISAHPSLAKNDKANMFSTVCEKEHMLSNTSSRQTNLKSLKIMNIISIFFVCVSWAIIAIRVP